MKRVLKIVKITLISLLSIFIVLLCGLGIYTSDSYQPLQAMKDEVALKESDELDYVNDFDEISYKIEDPKKNIIIMPGGKVNPQSYQYLGLNLALEGYDVTIVKTFFNLAILTPNYGARFLSDEIDNVVIGHSLGGTVASLFSSGDDRVKDLIFLASYPIADVRDKNVLVMTAEFDLVLDDKSLDESISLLPDNYTSHVITGGNHAQFGWYGSQKGDGGAMITVKEQQDEVILQTLLFID